MRGRGDLAGFLEGALYDNLSDGETIERYGLDHFQRHDHGKTPSDVTLEDTAAHEGFSVTLEIWMEGEVTCICTLAPGSLHIRGVPDDLPPLRVTF